MAAGGLIGGLIYDFRLNEGGTVELFGLFTLGGGSYDLAWVISIVASLAGVLFIALLEPTSRVLIPDWEDSLPRETEASTAAT